MTDVVGPEMDPYYSEHLHGPHAALWVEALQHPEDFLQTDEGQIRASSAGRPYGKPGGPRGGKAAGPRKAPAPPKKKPAAAGGGTRKGQADYLGPLTILSELPCIALNVAANALKMPVLAVDAATVRLHRPPVIQALNQMIVEDPRMSAGMERFFSGSVGGKVATGLAVALAAMPMVVQLAANHRKTPVTRETAPEGVYTHEELLQATGGGSPEAAMMDLLGAGGHSRGESSTSSPSTAHHRDAGPEHQDEPDPTIPLFAAA